MSHSEFYSLMYPDYVKFLSTEKQIVGKVLYELHGIFKITAKLGLLLKRNEWNIGKVEKSMKIQIDRKILINPYPHYLHV